MTKPALMEPRDLQLMMEYKYSRTNIRKYVRKDISECEEIQDKMEVCVRLIERWIDQDHYESKAVSLYELKEVDLYEMLIDVMTVLMVQPVASNEITKVVGQVCQFLPYENYMEAVKRMSEIFVKMAEADLIDISPAFNSEGNTVRITIKYFLEGDTAKYIQQAKFNPPMLCKPKQVTKNSEGGYLTFNKNRITKKLQQHDGDICLDVVNLANSTAYSLDIDLLYQVEDELDIDKIVEKLKEKESSRTCYSYLQIDPNKLTTVDIDSITEAFKLHNKQTKETAIELINLGNKFWFEWFYDYRGRFYPRGYEIHLQGTDYKKSMINFADEVPMEIDDKYKDMF